MTEGSNDITNASKASNRQRFETDLEFVQCLANPFYLQTLAQQSILSSEPFLNYLKYLAYFRDAKYAKFIHYPQALHHLQLVTESEAFREAVKTDEMVAELARAQVEHWKSWRELREGLPVATTSIAPAAYEAPSTSV